MRHEKFIYSLFIQNEILIYKTIQQCLIKLYLTRYPHTSFKTVLQASNYENKTVKVIPNVKVA